MAQANIGGVVIAYTDEGSGPPIVFIHGFPLNRRIWDEQVRDLSANARCIAIDLRGHGESEAIFWNTSVEAYADQVAGLLDHLEIESAVICGLSMGGYVTFAMWRKYRERVRAVVLAGTRAQPDTPEARQSRFNLALVAQRSGTAAVAADLLPRLVAASTISSKPETAQRLRSIIESTPPQGMTGDLAAMAERPDSVDLLPGIDVPALVIAGEQDALIPLADSQLMAERIPNARLVTIPDAGHMSNMEQPAAFTTALQAFLNTLA